MKKMEIHVYIHHVQDTVKPDECPKDGRVCPKTIRGRDCAKRKGNPAYVKGTNHRWRLLPRVKRIGNPNYVQDKLTGRWRKRRTIGRPRTK